MNRMLVVFCLALVVLGCKQTAMKTEGAKAEAMPEKEKAPTFTTPVVLHFTDSTLILNDSLIMETYFGTQSFQKDSALLVNSSRALLEKKGNTGAANITVVVDSSLQFDKVYHLFRATSTVYDTFFLYHNSKTLPVLLPKPTTAASQGGFGPGGGSGFGPGGGAGLGLGFSGGTRASLREEPKPRLLLTTAVGDSQIFVIAGGSVMIPVPFVVDNNEAFYRAPEESGITKVWRHVESGEFLFVGLGAYAGELEEVKIYRHMSFDANGNYSMQDKTVDPAQFELKPLKATELYSCLILDIRSQRPDAVDKDSMIYGIGGQVSMATVLTFAIAAKEHGFSNISFAKMRI